jgi:hypothetical protein
MRSRRAVQFIDTQVDDSKYGSAQLHFGKKMEDKPEGW